MSYRPTGPGHRARSARVDLSRIPDPEAGLTDRLGPLARFEMQVDDGAQVAASDIPTSDRLNALATRLDRARRRLVEECAAQSRGGVAAGRDSKNLSVARHNAQVITGSDLGLRRGQIHGARLIRDAELKDPGSVRCTRDERLAHGEEPARTALDARADCLQHVQSAHDGGAPAAQGM